MDSTKANIHLMGSIQNRSALVDSETALATAHKLYARVKLTKFETLCCRAFRDSRRKREHIERYIVTYTNDAHDDWKQDCCPALAQRICDLLAPGGRTGTS